jgi:beta-lactamase class A
LTRRQAAAVIAVAVLAVVSVAVALTSRSPGSSRGIRAATRTSPVKVIVSVSLPSAPPSAAPPRHADPFGSLAQDEPGSVLAAVYDVSTGQEWSIGTGRPQAEASIVKLDILESLLARDHAALPAADLPVAQSMMEDSDNDAATALWYASGGAAGIGAYNAAVGLRSTTMSGCVQCADFPWPGWGLTTTTPADQIVLLRQLLSPRSVLSAGQRRYVLGLMENVAPDQRWGVSGGVPAGVTVALKNGWLPLDAADDDWQINSVGWISGDGRDYLLAVLTTGNPSEQAGIDLIDNLSAIVWQDMG